MKAPKLNKDWLPVAGIAAFAACSIHAVAQLLFSKAQHDTWLFWVAACLIELCTAWLIWSVVETTRKVTKSNISKQDRKFYSIVLAAFTVLAIPSLIVSVYANTLEFGNLLLGLLFPSLSVACAVGAGLPETVRKHETRNREDAEAAKKKAAARRKEKVKAEEAARKEAEAKREWESKLMGMCDNALAILRAYAENPVQSKSAVGEQLGIDRKLVGYHLGKLDSEGLVERENGQVRVLVPMEYMA